MANENNKPKSVTLWKDNSGWVVYAGVRDNGDVEICSDGTHEWYAIVPASDIKHLKSALAAVVPGKKSESVLPLLLDVFGRAPEAKNPFDDIKRFLDAHSIPWKPDFWFADRQTRVALESAQQQYVASGGKTMTTQEKIAEQDKLNAQSGRLARYEYYVLGNDIPVRFLLDHGGGRYGAEWPGKEKGSLVKNVRLITRLEEDPMDFTLSNAEEFARLLDNYVQRPAITISPEAEKLYQDHLTREKAKGKTSGGRE